MGGMLNGLIGGGSGGANPDPSASPGILSNITNMLGGDPNNLYGTNLTPQQSQALNFQRFLTTLQATGANSGPSRLPVPIGVAASKGALTAQQNESESASNILKNQLSGQQLQRGDLENQQMKQRFGMMQSVLQQMGMAPTQGSAGQPAPQPGLLGPSPAAGGSAGFVPNSGAAAVAAQTGPAPNGAPAPLLSSPPAGNPNLPSMRLLGPAMVADMFVPGAGKAMIDKSIPGPSAFAPLIAERNNLAPSDPMRPYYDMAISKAAGLPEGMTIGPNGQAQYIPGYVGSEAGKAGAVSSATNWAGVGPTEAINNAKPVELRGPGSTAYFPSSGKTVQVANEIPTVDENGRPLTKFVPLGVSVSGGSGQPQGQGAPGPGPGTAPAATPPGSSGFTAGGATSFSGSPVTPLPPSGGQPPASSGSPQTGYPTGLPPGQKKIIEGAAENYTSEGRKAYESAVGGLSSLEFINRDIDQMGQQGWAATGEGANARLGLAKTINSWETAAGLSPSFDPSKIASWEDFRKETTLLGMKGLASMFGGSREAASIVTTSINAVPNPENSYVGAKLLTNAYKEGFQREVDLRNFETNYAQQHGGNLTGAQETFNQLYPPQSYSQRAISKVQPYAVSSPQDLQKFLPGTFVKTPGGIKVVPGNPSVQYQQPQAQQ